jgi:hypothetical protein
MCDCFESPAPTYNPLLHLAWQDERNDARYQELMATLRTTTERRGDLYVRTMTLHEDAPRIFIPSTDLWTPPGQLVFGNELLFRLELMRLGGRGGFRRAAAAERPADPKTPCAACEEQKCGPNVTSEVQAAVTKTKTQFAGWDDGHKSGACTALVSLQKTPAGERMAAVAWDINDLHAQGWIATYRPLCSAPPCQNTVQVGNQCYYAGTANYVIFGVMCKLCHDYYGWSPTAVEFSETAMIALITAYKGALPGRPASANFEPCKKWARAGYEGWPAVAVPPGDRPACSPSCPTPYGGTAFSVNWHWLQSNGMFHSPTPVFSTF